MCWHTFSKWGFIFQHTWKPLRVPLLLFRLLYHWNYTFCQNASVSLVRMVSDLNLSLIPSLRQMSDIQNFVGTVLKLTSVPNLPRYSFLDNDLFIYFIRPAVSMWHMMMGSGPTRHLCPGALAPSTPPPPTPHVDI